MEDVSPSPGHSVQRTSKDTHVSFTGWGRGEKAWGRREERVMRGKMGAGCDSWTCSAGAARPGGWSRSHTQLFVVFLLHREAGYFPEPGRRISVAWPPSPAAHMTSVVGKPLKMAQKTRMWAKKGANIHFFQNSGALQAPWRLQLVTVPGPAFNKWLKGEKKKPVTKTTLIFLSVSTNVGRPPTHPAQSEDGIFQTLSSVGPHEPGLNPCVVLLLFWVWRSKYLIILYITCVFPNRNKCETWHTALKKNFKKPDQRRRISSDRCFFLSQD